MRSLYSGIISQGVGARQCRAPTGVPHTNEKRYIIAIAISVSAKVQENRRLVEERNPTFSVVFDANPRVLIYPKQILRRKYHFQGLSNPDKPEIQQ